MASGEIKLLIVDDHAIFREGLKLLVEADPRFVVVGEASSGPEAVARAAQAKPDIVILDIAMPQGNGIDAIAEIREASPGSRIIVLSTFSERRLVIEALEAGASGYALKSGAFGELHAAVERVLSGGRYLSPALAEGFIDLALERDGGRQAPDPLSVLSPRERGILRKLCEEKSPKAIGFELGISRKTVDIHKRNIMRKLGLRTDASLIKLAMKEGLLLEE
jgi:DNA-binding NarL/FixJ family response regulator